MVTPESMVTVDYIEHGLPCEHVERRRRRPAFRGADRQSAAFSGKSRVQQHQLVYAALGDRMREEIHALSMQTLTPEEWREQADDAEAWTSC